MKHLRGRICHLFTDYMAFFAPTTDCTHTQTSTTEDHPAVRAHVYSYLFLTSWLFEVLTSRVNVIRKREARPVMIGVMVNSGCLVMEP